MKKIIYLIAAFMLLPVAFGAQIFNDEFSDSNITNQNWESSGIGQWFENSTHFYCADGGCGIYQNMTNISYSGNWTAVFKYSAFDNAPEDYLMLAIGDTQDTSGNVYYIQMMRVINYGDNATFFLETLGYGDYCAKAVETSEMFYIGDFNMTESHTFEIRHHENNTLYIYGDVNLINITDVPCDLSGLFTILYIREETGQLDSFSLYDTFGYEEGCVPDWNCSAFAECSINISECINVTDLNMCGEEFSGNLSLYNEPCNCTAAWVCDGYGNCIVEKKTCNSAYDMNSCGMPYSGDYTEFTKIDCSEAEEYYNILVVIIILLPIAGFGYLIYKKFK
jgi:hypothetical protein